MKKMKTILALVLALTVILAMTSCTALTTETTSAETQSTTGSIFSLVGTFGLMIVLFYFLLIRPENKRKKQVNEMRTSLQVGDDITTIGGVVGKIISIKDDLIVIETGADRVRMELARWAVSTKGTQTTEQR